MKKRLKDFLAGVGSVLDINPNVEISFKFDGIKISIGDSAISDLDKIGGDFKVVGDDLNNSIEAVSIEHQGSVVLNFNFKGGKVDSQIVSKAVQIARLIKMHQLHTDFEGKRISVGPNGKIDWNDYESEELKTQ